MTRVERAYGVVDVGADNEALLSTVVTVLDGDDVAILQAKAAQYGRTLG